MSELKKIHVSELRTGMHVSKLDREWLDTPFLMQGFVIESAEDAAIVAEYCEHVWIDVHTTGQGGFEHSSNEGTASQAPHRVNYINQSSAREEHKKVWKVFKEARNLTKFMLEDVRLGGSIDTPQAKETVNHCVQSVIRNPDALVWMAKMRNENEYTAEHCLNVCILAIAFGRQLGLPEKNLYDLGLCGLLHDVGKMRVPSEVLNKPGRLTDKEMRMMKAHTVHGRNLLLADKEVQPGIVEVAYSHHERLDGTGYPRKLDPADISQFTRIISIVDAYDAMTGDRCYSPAKTSTEALKIIYNERGKQFDGKLALRFIKTVGLYPPGSIVELVNGEVGIVVEVNQNLRHLPKVILLLDSDRESLEQQRIVDLSLVEKGELSKNYLIKHVWRDGSFGIFIREYRQKGVFFNNAN